MARLAGHLIVFLGLIGLLTACPAGGPAAGPAANGPSGGAIIPILITPSDATGSGTDPNATTANRGEIDPKADKDVIVTKPTEPSDPLHQTIGDRDGMPGGDTPPPPPPPPPTFDPHQPKDPTAN